MQAKVDKLEAIFNLVRDGSKEIRTLNPYSDGRSFWQPVKGVLDKLDKKAEEEQWFRGKEWKQIGPSPGIEGERWGTLDEKNKQRGELNHFLNQQVRIPTGSEFNFKKIVQVGLNIGQYLGSENEKDKLEAYVRLGRFDLDFYLDKPTVQQLSEYIDDQTVTVIKTHIERQLAMMDVIVKIIGGEMTKYEKLSAILKLLVDVCGINQNSYVVIGSYALREHREISDLDVCMLWENFNKLWKLEGSAFGEFMLYNRQVRYFVDFTQLYNYLNEDEKAKDFSIEIFQKCIGDGFPNKEFAVDVLNDMQSVESKGKFLGTDPNGHHYFSLETLLKWKKIMNREKDKPDIAKIVELLGRSAPSASTSIPTTSTSTSTTSASPSEPVPKAPAFAADALPVQAIPRLPKGFRLADAIRKRDK